MLIYLLFITTLAQDLFYVQDPQALCLDGTRGSYYFAEGYGTGSNKYIFHFEGGGWIEGLNKQQLLYSAYQRSQTPLGSSKFNSPTYNYEGFFSRNQNRNPDFYNWNIININYCDGTGHQGHKTDPQYYEGNMLYFRGEKIVKSIISEFFIRMGQAEVVIISGCSAGGLAAYYWVDHFREILPQTVKVLGVPDSGIFIDMKAFDGSQNYKINLNQMMNLVNQETNNPNKECVENNPSEQWKCFFAQYLTRYIQLPIFIVNSLYDSASINGLLGIKCTKSTYSLSQCTEKEVNYIELMHQNIYTVIYGRGYIYSDTGSFAPSCLEHCFLQTSYYTSLSWQIPYQSGVTLQQGLRHWLNSLNIGRDDNHIDIVDWPENEGCANI